MHYERDKDKLYITEQSERKQRELSKNYQNEVNSLRFKKAIAKICEIIIKKDTAILSNKDYEEVAKVYYGNCTKLNTLSIKRKMTTQIAKDMINSELISLYNKANLTKERIPDLLSKAEGYADEKKDGNLILKIAEKLEKAHNLTPTNGNTPQNQLNIQQNFHQFRDDDKKDVAPPVETQSESAQDSNEPENKSVENEENAQDSQNDTVA